MRIYVACLASYNNGRLHGAWIDADCGADAIRAEIAEMLRASPYPNVRITCAECDGSGRNIGIGQEPHVCSTCAGTGTVPSAEEWAVHDYDDIPSHWGEYPDLDKLAAYCEAASELDDSDREAFDEWLAVRGTEPGDLDDFRDQYQGAFDTLEDWAYRWHDDAGTFHNVPDTIANYFDYEKWARDCDLGGDIWTVRGDHGLHVFNNH